MGDAASRPIVAAPAADGARGRATPRLLLGAGVVAALLGVVYARTGATLWRTWTTNDDYSHGPLVPLASLAVAWALRRRVTALPSRADARGIGLVALACALVVGGVRSDVFALEGYSLVAMAFGLSWTFLGWPRTRALAFPLGYLVFMLTFPPFVMNQLGYGLKEITVRVSTAVGEALGVQLQRSGMTLYLAGGELRIENPCSGLRSLLALLATAALFAYFQPGAAWRRLALVLAGVPIAVLGNAVRITLLVLVGHYGSVRQATGWFHDWSGYLTYAAALAALFGLRAVLTPRAAGRPA